MSSAPDPPWLRVARAEVLVGLSIYEEDYRVTARSGLQLVVQQSLVEDADVLGGEVREVDLGITDRVPPRPWRMWMVVRVRSFRISWTSPSASTSSSKKALSKKW